MTLPRQLAVPSGPPNFRRLRVFTFDPSLATKLDTARINETVLRVPWEKSLEPGPVGDYLEVVDYDPASDCFYAPVDLNDAYLLAEDGLTPSEGNPKFHQQMVYAVAMTTIHSFEVALGRRALWAPHLDRNPETGEVVKGMPVHRLRVYPHALREANAYYSPDKKALLFGYFPAILANPEENLPGGLVFTCLSHDVVAHETTHALLDGLHRYFGEASNPDVLAFHEAFADIVALFQHFKQTDALQHQIKNTRGDLASQNLLGELAHQFGQAIGSHGALRDAIGRVNPQTGKWEPQVPDAEAYQTTVEPHARGAILVAAMFDAFLSIYKSRIADLLRIATGGTGVLSPGSIHPDLANRLADEASGTASHILHIVLRSLDYVPPVDITFGEFLRGMVTADCDLFPDDARGYRLAIIESFRRRGIYPRDVRTLAVDALRWPPPDGLPSFADLIVRLRGISPQQSLAWPDDRVKSDELSQTYQSETWKWIHSQKFDNNVAKALGLALDSTASSTIHRGKVDHMPALEVHSVRPTFRRYQDGRTTIDLVVEMTQRKRAYLDPKRQAEADNLPVESPQWAHDFIADFRFRGGCTLLIDGESGKVRYCIVKDINSKSRLDRQRAYALNSADMSLRATYATKRPGERVREPFALLHRSC